MSASSSRGRCPVHLTRRLDVVSTPVANTPRQSAAKQHHSSAMSAVATRYPASGSDFTPPVIDQHSYCRYQRLPNGNTFICEGAWGRFFEVTPDKEVVWEFTNPFYSWRTEFQWTNQVFRAYRYGPDHAALKGKNLDPDRVELTLREKPMGQEQAIQERLGRLGY